MKEKLSLVIYDQIHKQKDDAEEYFKQTTFHNEEIKQNGIVFYVCRSQIRYNTIENKKAWQRNSFFFGNKNNMLQPLHISIACDFLCCG